MHKFFTITLIFTSLFLTAQTTSDFENFNLQEESFLNGSDGNGGFSTGNIFLPNSYEDAFGSWTGWSISNLTDSTTPGFTNQYSAITGGGENSASYAIAYTGGGRVNLTLENEAEGEKVNGFYITNSTYAALSMQEGDSFAKRFGGLTGSDPDYFLLTIKKYENDELSTDSVDVYLADYRFEDNTQDYILNEWTYVDLTSLGTVDSLQFFLSSTDVGTFGMNTPAYFCIDNLTTSDGTTGLDAREKMSSFEIYPNPCTDFIHVKNASDTKFTYRITDLFGRPFSDNTFHTEAQIDVRFLPKGSYILELVGANTQQTQLFFKQ